MNYTLTSLDNDVIRSILRDVITPADAPHNLMCIFAGVRKAEADSSLWTNLQYQRRQALIYASSQCRRAVPVCLALEAWLEPYLGLVGRLDATGLAGDHFSDNLKRRRIALRAQAFRTNYGLNRLALGVDSLQVARELGYNNSRLLFHKTLFNPITGMQAEEFFGLTPEACGRPQWPSEVAEWRRQYSVN